MQPYFRRGFSVVALIACSGCATVFKGSNSTFDVAGLKAADTLKTMDGVDVPHDAEHVSIASNDGTRALVAKTPGGEKPIAVHRFVGAGWIVLDVVFGLVPLIVDGATGNWWEYDDVKLPAEIAHPAEVVDPQTVDRAVACKAAGDYDARAATADSPVKEQLQKLAARKHKDCGEGGQKP